MYDTVHSFLEVGSACGGISPLVGLPARLNRATLHERDDGQTYLSGYLENLRVNVNDRGVSVQGSMCSFHLKTNVAGLSRGDMQRATERLSDALGLPMKTAKVTRVDVAKNLFVQHPPAVYLPYLGVSQYYQRLVQPQSLYYRNAKRTLVFYDKVAECKAEGADLPDIWAGKNVLRYEGRFMRRLPEQFNRAALTLADLTDERFYIGIVDRWVKEFLAIRKVERMALTGETLKSVKDFENLVFQMGLQAMGGETEVLELIDHARQQGAFDNRTQINRIRNRVKEISQRATVEPSAGLIADVEEQVKRVQRYYR